MKENDEIRFRTTTEKKKKIREKAEKVGMTIKQYLLYLGINSTIEVKIG